MLFAWLAISNHCALGGLVKNTRNGQAHTRCCGNNAPQHDGKAPDSGTRECCQTLNALPPITPAKIAHLEATPLTIFLAWALVDESLRAEPERCLELLDSGPPWARSFAEVVLQRSLLSHAPPFAI